ncbi:MAG TPA: hypothetical protein VFR09_07890 [Alphaproteobacteria bacterium]|nr:hypothetical protein [Alphaproteobacteria bacterium]
MKQSITYIGITLTGSDEQASAAHRVITDMAKDLGAHRTVHEDGHHVAFIHHDHDIAHVVMHGAESLKRGDLEVRAQIKAHALVAA